MAPARVFISYAREDQQLHEKLVKYLIPLKNSGKIAIWHDQEILPGTEWGELIKTSLFEADIILLLVSADFLASDYCYGVEMQQALKRHEDGEARVIPIILKPADWQDTPLGRLQALPTNAKAITQWHDQDEALADVAQGIRKVVEKSLREDEHGKIGTLLGDFINSALPKVKEIVTLNTHKLSLIGYVLLIGCFLLGAALYFFINDMSLLIWFVAPLIVISLTFLLIYLEAIRTDISVKTMERRVLLSAVLPLSLLTILGSSLLKMGNAKRELETGQLTQLRIGISGGDLNSSDTQSFVDALSNSLGIPVSARFGTYSNIINALGRRDLEMAWMGPFGYLRARQIYNARALLCQKTPEGNKVYNTYIIVNASANIHTLDDLKGKNLALSDPSSTSGRVIPLYELQQAGFNLDTDIQTSYVGSQNVIDYVLSNRYPAGATSSIAYNNALAKGKFHPDDLIIVQKSKDIPIGPFVIRNDIQHYDELRIEDAFFTIADTDPSIRHTLTSAVLLRLKATAMTFSFVSPMI